MGCSEKKDQTDRAVFINDARIDDIKHKVDKGDEPTTLAFAALKTFADKNLSRQANVPREWYVPGYYDDAEGHRSAKGGLQDEANAAYGLALYYRLSGETRYAETAISIIDAWASGVETMSRQDDSMLSFSYHFPALVFAADLLKNEPLWPPDKQEQFERFLDEKALQMNTMDRKNNWGNWGLVLVSSIAAYRGNEELLKTCAHRWQEFIEQQIAEDGHLPHEVKRSKGRHGIWYTHFSLMPQTIAAEILRVNGIDLYDYQSPSARTLKSAFERVAEWNLAPETFGYWQGEPNQLVGLTYYSYFEILNPLWPNESATRLLEKRRPMTATHSAPFLTLTHGM